MSLHRQGLTPATWLCLENNTPQSYLNNKSLNNYFESELIFYHPAVLTFQAIVFLLMEVVGNFLLSALIIHEKFGMDPQKRTVTNQLMSSLCLNLIIFNILIMPVFWISRIYELTCKFFSNFLIFCVSKSYSRVSCQSLCDSWDVFFL